MSDLQVFGPLIIGTELGDAVTLTLQTWMPTYLGMIDRHISQPPGWLQNVQSYAVRNDPDHWPEEQSPAVVIAIPGTLGTPHRDGKKNYRVEWDTRITVFVSATDAESTERLAKYYGAAVRSIVLGKASLGDFAAGTTWHGEYYSTRVADTSQRSLGSCENRFCVDVRDVVQALNGPLVPATDPDAPPADWPLATKVTVTVTPTAIPT